jgi:drug/metabolite transporter (DMT)-like permease
MNAAGVLFALLTTLSWSIGIFPFTLAARRLGANALNHFRLLLAALITLLISFLISPVEFLNLFSPERMNAWIWLGLSGFIGLTVGDHFGFAMYAILGPRLGSVLSTFAPGAALGLGMVVTNDHLSPVGILGMAITICGVIVLSLSRTERSKHTASKHGSLSKGVVYGILAALCQGAGLVLAKKGMIPLLAGQTAVPPFHATFIRLSAATFTLFLVTTLTGRWKYILPPVLSNQENGIPPAVWGTFFGPVIGVAMSLFTVSLLDASVAQTIFSLVPVVTLLIAVFRYKEHISTKALAGVMVAVGGVVVLVWRDTIESFFHHLPI